MSTGSVRSPPPGGAPASTSVTCWPFSCLYRQNGWPPAGPSAGHGRPGSDVEEPDVLGVALDEGAACLHVLAHQHAEQLVGLGRVVQRDLQQHPPRRVHRGLPQLASVHLTEALEALHASELWETTMNPARR